MLRRAFESLEERRVSEQLGLGALQAGQVAGIDHVKAHLLQPPFEPANLVLWGAPFLVVAVGGGLWMWRRRRAGEALPLSSEEEAKLAQIAADEVD